MPGLNSILAALNAGLNLFSAISITGGLFFIWRQQRRAHMQSMIAAASFSTLFLISYLTRYGLFGSTPFAGVGWIRPVYYTLLWSHIVLAMVGVPLILTTLYRTFEGYRTGDFSRHRTVARITYPIWLYVSITGVAVYLMLHQVYS